ncbi:MAG: cell division protein FtsQ/DivIB [Spirochaetaceae bacterium]
MADVLLKRGPTGSVADGRPPRTAGRTARRRRTRARTERHPGVGEHERFREDRGRERNGDRDRNQVRTSRILLVVIVVLSVVLVGELAFHFLVAPRLTISEITVDSEVPFTDEELLALGGLEQVPAFFAVDPARIERNLESHPTVRDASVQKVFPNRLGISITGRKPLLVTLAEQDGSATPVAVDADGVVFDVERNLASLDLPLVSGIRFEGFAPGAELPDMLHGFLEDVQELRLEHPDLFDQISEYRVVRRGEHDFEVVLYPTSYRTPVRIGRELDGSLCRYIIMVLDAFDRDGRLEDIEEFDFRAGEIVYRTKEG